MIPLDLEHLLTNPDPTNTRPRRNTQTGNPLPNTPTLDDWLWDAAAKAVTKYGRIELTHLIHNTDRTVGARLAGEIARRYADAGLPDDTVRVTFRGSAGQSFGAFCINGMTLILIGEANDYVGKSMAGGAIIVRPPETATWATEENFIIGNTVLYGATGGKLFAAGRAGERFAVRNSGATAVVEGAGDHACEYMTGGTVIVLGETGHNLGAGLTGGYAFVLDRAGTLAARLNKQTQMEPLTHNADHENTVFDLVKEHADVTHSRYARGLLDHWRTTRDLFWRIVPS